jgi:hypothetical protein
MNQLTRQTNKADVNDTFDSKASPTHPVVLGVVTVAISIAVLLLLLEGCIRLYAA